MIKVRYLAILLLVFTCCNSGTDTDRKDMVEPIPENSVYYLEIVTNEVEQMCAMYSSINGWQFDDPDPNLGNARVAKLPGGTLCGIRAPMHSEEKPIVRTYMRVGDLDSSVQKAKQSGFEILIERMEIPGHGFIAIFEKDGIQQGLWQLTE